jgi:hypothetical protein
MTESTITTTAQWTLPEPVMLNDSITYSLPYVEGQRYTVTFDR